MFFSKEKKKVVGNPVSIAVKPSSGPKEVYLKRRVSRIKRLEKSIAKLADGKKKSALTHELEALLGSMRETAMALKMLEESNE